MHEPHSAQQPQPMLLMPSFGRCSPPMSTSLGIQQHWHRIVIVRFYGFEVFFTDDKAHDLHSTSAIWGFSCSQLSAGHKEICRRCHPLVRSHLAGSGCPLHKPHMKRHLPEVLCFGNDGLRLMAPRTHTKALSGCFCTDPNLRAAIKATLYTHVISKMLSYETK